jgi:hypothetical protein
MHGRDNRTPCKSQSLSEEPGPNSPCKSGDGGQSYTARSDREILLEHIQRIHKITKYSGGRRRGLSVEIRDAVATIALTALIKVGAQPSDLY